MASSYESPQPLAIPGEVLAYDYINRARNRNYAELLKLDIKQREQARKQQVSSKSLQRKTLSEAVQKELELKNISKLHRLQYQQLYRNDNLKLSQLHKSMHTSVQPPLPKEHPFVRLVDQQDMRNSQLREKFKYQNKFNEIQESIKQSQKELNRRSDRTERQMYEQYVQEDFAKRDHSYKKLKLLHTERRVVDMNDGDLKKLERDAQHDYLLYLQHQTEERKQNKMVERNNQSLDVNRYAAVEYGQSPAYLGLLPFEADRKRQLDVIDRKFGFAVPKYLQTLTKNIKDENPRVSYKEQQNPQYGRLKLMTQGPTSTRIHSQQASPITSNSPYNPVKDLKLPVLRQPRPMITPRDMKEVQQMVTIDHANQDFQKTKRKSSMAVRTELDELPPRIRSRPTPDLPNHRMVRNYNFITGGVDVYQVPI